MKVWHWALALSLASTLLAAPAFAAAPGAAAITSEEVVVTYARGGIEVFEIASAPKGSLIALPIIPGATGITVRGGTYSLTRETGTGRAAMVQSASGSAQATFRVPYPANGNFLFVWRSPARIGRLVLLTGSKVNPSGLGIAPFHLGGQVSLGGQFLTSFNAQNLPADYAMRWPFEVGDPGGWLGNVFLGLAIAVPLAALLLGIRGLFAARRRAAGA